MDRSPRSSITTIKKFKLVIKLKYDAQPGETVSVVGSLDRLGNMQDFKKCPMRLKVGTTNIWQTTSMEFDRAT